LWCLALGYFALAVISALSSREDRDMHQARRAAIVAISLVLVAGVLIYSVRRPASAATIVGVVRATEVRVNRR